MFAEIYPQGSVIDEFDIIMNTLVRDPTNVLNAVAVMIKQYIYRARCFRTKPNIQELKQIILQNYRNELLGACIKGKGQKCTKKWLYVIERIRDW